MLNAADTSSEGLNVHRLGRFLSQHWVSHNTVADVLYWGLIRAKLGHLASLLTERFSNT